VGIELVVVEGLCEGLVEGLGDVLVVGRDVEVGEGVGVGMMT